MLVFPKAKINLGLRITGKRSDGYHNIETLFYPVGLCDAMEIVLDKDDPDNDSLKVSGYQLSAKTEKNIVLSAIGMLRNYYNVPGLKIHLHKVIPEGAGLGGGSSDAVCTLKTLKRILHLPVTYEELKLISASLGSDCPFFIDCIPSYATGRGEILTPVDDFLRGFYIVLINPGRTISTKEAYDNCIVGMPSDPLTDLLKHPVNKWKDKIFNDFERTIFMKYPEIEEIKNALYDTGAIYSSMSGSGSTVYGIYEAKPLIPEELRKLVVFEGDL